MAEARCENPRCGRTFYKKNGSQRFCTRACREAVRGSKPRYSYRHQQIRKRVGQSVRAGDASCARCGEPIHPAEPWDLDHADDGRGYLGPSHRACNRATSKSETYEDDPAKGIYWGPMRKKRGGHPEHLRWSRAWYDWRAGST